MVMSIFHTKIKIKTMKQSYTKYIRNKPNKSKKEKIISAIIWAVIIIIYLKLK